MNNPFDFGRNILETWEKTMSETIEKMAHDENFLKNMSKVFTKSIDVKKTFEGQIEKLLQNVNIPSRGDLERMLVYLQRIEEKLLDLEDAFSDFDERLKSIEKACLKQNTLNSAPHETCCTEPCEEKTEKPPIKEKIAKGRTTTASKRKK
ncbi:MAG: hypothetical protein HQM08_09605 [Candidatus Riflebacteria bacterium]|nr:hypothetical protein [Candidatus Riflebacteria bacterium]